MIDQRALFTEEKLISAIKTKTPAGAEALYDMYSKSLFGVLLKIVNNRELAEDLLQQSFLKIWTSIDSYDAEKGRLFTWMITIARNLGLDCLRSKVYRQLQSNEPIETHFNYIEQHNLSNLNTDTIGVKECVDLLKDEHKNILNLIYLQGYTQIEAAEKLNIPVGTLKTRCRKALGLMRQSFN